MAKKPSARQLKFVDLYLSDPERNASKAYRDAGFKSKNPDVDAAQLLVNPSIKPIIEARLKKIQEIASEKFEITQERILQELAAIAFVKPTEFIEWEGNTVTIKPSEDLTEWQRATIASIEQGYTDTGKKYLKIKHHDRVDALKVLGKHTGLWSKLNGKDGSGGSGRDTKATLARISELLRKRRQ